MISNKYINIISIALIILAIIFSVSIIMNSTVVFNPSLMPSGDFYYENGQSISVNAEDYYTDYTKSFFTEITLLNDSFECENTKNVISDENGLKILSGGVYELSGSFDKRITVANENNSTVRIVLNGAEINSQGPSIYLENAGKVIISTLKDTVNSLNDVSETVNELDAVLYSKEDLVLNGEGVLNITSPNADGIKANDSLKITGGTFNITSADEGINTNDYIALLGGNVTVSSGGDAIRCENTDDEEYGFIVIEDGVLSLTSGADAIDAGNDIYINNVAMTINASDDAVHTEKYLFLNGGSINIESCTEGLEGAFININDGEYTIIAKDDAINATGENSFGGGMARPGGMAGGNTLGETYLTINGGKIYALAGGDGIDSNSAAEINGGYIEVYGPENSGNSTMDFDGGYVINGGELICAGSSGMAERPNASSKQNVIVLTLSKTYEAGTEIKLTDSEGKVILSGTSEKRFDWILLSSSQIFTDETYTVNVGGNNESNVTVSETVTNISSGVSGFKNRGF